MKYNPDIHHRRSIRLKGYDYSQAGAYFVTICAYNRACLFGEIADRQMMLNDAGRMVENVWNQLPIRFDPIELDEFVVMPNHIHGIFALRRRGEPCRGEPCVRPGVGPDSPGPHNSQWGEHKVRPYIGSDMPGNRTSGEHLDEHRGEHKVRPYIGHDLPGDQILGEPCRGESCIRPGGGESCIRPDVGPDMPGNQTSGRPCGTLPNTVGRIVQAFKSITTNEYINGVKQNSWPPFPGKLWQRNYYDHIIRNEDALHRIREYIATNPMKWEFDRENPSVSILETPGGQWEGPS
jgi:putative transposase